MTRSERLHCVDHHPERRSVRSVGSADRVRITRFPRNRRASRRGRAQLRRPEAGGIRRHPSQRGRLGGNRELRRWGIKSFSMPADLFVIADRTFTSRLIIGTGKYPSNPVMVKAHEASGADMVTVAVRRVNITDRSKESLLDYIDSSRFFLLPNTAGCYTADDAIRTARLGREAGLANWVKLEVIGDERTLFPDNEALVGATRVLVRAG